MADFTWCVSVNAASISSSSCLYGRSLQCTVLIRKAEAIPHARKLLHACDERPLSDGCTATSPHYQLSETRQRPRILRRPCLAGYHIKRIPIARSQCCVPARRRCGSKLAVMGGLSGERPAPGERTISNERVVTDDNAHGRREKKGYWTVEDVFEPLWTNLAFAGAEARAEVPTLALRRRTLALVTLGLSHRHTTRNGTTYQGDPSLGGPLCVIAKESEHGTKVRQACSSGLIPFAPRASLVYDCAHAWQAEFFLPRCPSHTLSSFMPPPTFAH